MKIIKPQLAFEDEYKRYDFDEFSKNRKTNSLKQIILEDNHKIFDKEIDRLAVVPNKKSVQGFSMILEKHKAIITNDF